MKTLAAWIVLTAVTSAAAAPAARPRPRPRPKAGFEMLRIALYHNDTVLQPRVASVDDLARYMKAVQEACRASLADVTAPGALDVVVALKPGRRSRLWFITSTPVSPGAARLSALQAQLLAIPAPEVRGGPVAFAIIGALGSVRRPNEAGNDLPPPVPAEWKAAAKNRKNVEAPDGMIALAWPD